jgi:O-antigen/teichoic acid export membrane protein
MGNKVNIAETSENPDRPNRTWIRFLPAFVRERIEGREYLQNVIGNTGWQFADQVLRMGVGLVIWIWLARYLGPEQFGILNFALAFVSLFTPLASLGLDDIVVRNLVRDPASGNETLGSAFLLKLIGGLASLIAAVIAIVVLRAGDRLTQGMVAIIAVGAAFQAFQAIEFWFNSQVQAKYVVIAKNVAFLSCAVVKIILILVGATVLAFAWIATVEVIAGAAALTAAYRWGGNRIGEWRSSQATAKALLKDSWPLIFSSIAIIIYLRIDQVMLGEMVGSKEVGIYSVAVRMAEVWFFIPSAIYWSVLPSLVVAKETSDALFNERLQKYYNLMALMAYAIAIPVTLLANWLVVFLFGAPYGKASIILIVLIWANLFIYLEYARFAFFNVMNWNRIYFVTLALGAALNVILNLFLIPRYGGLGAAIASCISYWFAAHGACFLYKPLRETGFMLTKAMIYPKIW